MEIKRIQSIALMVAAVAIGAIAMGYLQYRESRDLEKSAFAFILSLAVIWIFFALTFGRARQRESALARVASALGFSFRSFDAEWTKPLAELPLLKRKGSPQIRNLIRGVKEGREVLLFDYMFTEGDAHRNQTAVAWRLREDRLPHFELAPEGFFQHLLGGGDIDFASHSEFSNRYFLTGPDEQMIRAVFQPRVLDAFTATRESWIVQGDGEWLVMYRARVAVRPTTDALSRFLEDGYIIFSAFGKN